MATMVMALLVALAAGDGDGYGHGIGKSTYAASEPTRCYDFFDKFLPVRCQDPPTFGFCNSTGECATSGRAALCDAADIDPDGGGCSFPESILGDFGLHAVNVTSRPGFPSILAAERIFETQWNVVLATGTYDPILDFTTMLFAPSVDKYVAAFEKARIQHVLVGPWRDSADIEHWSVLARPCGMMILELVTSVAPASWTRTEWAVRVSEDLVRLPSSVFSALNTSSQDPRILQPLGVSKGATDIDAVKAFYGGPMRARVDHETYDDGGNALVVFGLENAGAVVRFVSRGQGGEPVRALEGLKHALRTKFDVDPYCGVDKFYDNHYDYVQYAVPLDNFTRAFDRFPAVMHVFGNGTVPYSVYVTDPTGDAIQLVGRWTTSPDLARGDALADACSQGNCERFDASAPCRAALAGFEALRLRKARCADALYGAYDRLEAAGCTNADVANFCVPAVH